MTFIINYIHSSWLNNIIRVLKKISKTAISLLTICSRYYRTKVEQLECLTGFYIFDTHFFLLTFNTEVYCSLF